MIVGISGYVGNRLTGIGRVLISVVDHLASMYPQDKYIIFHNHDFTDYECLRSHSNVCLVAVPYTKESGLKNIFWHQWLFQKLLKKYHCDVAYIPNFTLLLWKIIPTVVTIHDLIEFNVPEKFSAKRMFYRKKICDPLMAKRSDLILTVSQSSCDDIVKYLHVPAKKLVLTPNATDKNFFKKYDCKDVLPVLDAYSLKYKEYLLFVGTIDYPGKNIKTVLEAFFNLKKKGGLENKKLVIVGKDGFNSRVIYDFVKTSEFKEDVVFTGYLKDEYLPRLYAGATIMLYLSLFEGFGLPVLEAMSCGTPVICSDTSCFPEIVGKMNVCVSPTDVEAVERKIVAMIENPELYCQLSEKCYSRSLEFSWDKSAVLYHDAFISVAKN